MLRRLIIVCAAASLLTQAAVCSSASAAPLADWLETRTLTGAVLLQLADPTLTGDVNDRLIARLTLAERALNQSIENVEFHLELAQKDIQPGTASDHFAMAISCQLKHRARHENFAEACLKLEDDEVQSDNKVVQATIHNTRSYYYYREGDHERSREEAVQALTLAEQIGDHTLLTVSHNMIGSYFSARLLPRMAILHMESAWENARQLPYPEAKTVIQINMASNYTYLGRAREALTMLTEFRDRPEMTLYPARQLIHQSMIAQAQVAVGELDNAEQELRSVMTKVSDKVLPDSLTFAYTSLGSIKLAKGLPNEALVYYDKVLEAVNQDFRTGANHPRVRLLFVPYARALRTAGQIDASRSLLRLAIDQASADKPDQLLVDLYEELSLTLAGSGDHFASSDAHDMAARLEQKLWDASFQYQMARLTASVEANRGKVALERAQERAAALQGAAEREKTLRFQSWTIAGMLLTVLLLWQSRRMQKRVADSERAASERLEDLVKVRTRELEDSNQQLAYQATFDELTGLYNRRHFQVQLKQVWDESAQSDVGAVLMYLDLDQFKIVNDTCGHGAGDQLLGQISRLIQNKIRADDTIARLGGDEFGIILKNCPPPRALRIAEAVRGTVEAFQFLWDGQIFRIGVSIGVVPIDVHRGDMEEWMKVADAACYAAKEAGRNQVHLVSDDSGETARNRGEMRWVHRLHQAMDNDLFAIYEQKILSLDNCDELDRVEILLRMRDPESRKLIPPGAFLPAAERYGLSVKLDEWVVNNLIRSLFMHNEIKAQGRRYWINLSGLSIGDPRFCESLTKLVADANLPRGMMNFEITESAVIRNIAEASRLIDMLSEMGCEFALDDFGTGLSSFGYLKKLKVNYLKIDGMFIRDIVQDQTDRIFVKSIIDIAHTLNMRTVAEFVEDDEILAIVKSLGADYAQGFGIHRPEMLAPNFPIPREIPIGQRPLSG